MWIVIIWLNCIIQHSELYTERYNLLKRIIPNIICLLLALFLFQNCQDNREVIESAQVVKKIEKSDTLKKKIYYSIEVQEIDSVKYNLVRQNSELTNKKTIKISDFETAKKMLKGVVFFNDNDEDGETAAILKIRFRNGKENVYTDEIEHFYFVAYYPSEDILLCEGGHTIDISFNLKTGQETEETGNPDIIDFSPKEKFRLNGYFGGQECYSYFIQKKINDQFVKIIQLDEEFEKLTKHWLCTIGESFWNNENTLYLVETGFEENGPSKHYFEIKLIEK